MTALVRARVDDEVRDRAAAVLDEIGLTVSDVVRMLLTRIARDGALPIELTIPNAETRAAMLRARGVSQGQFASLDELMNDLEKAAEQ